MVGRGKRVFGSPFLKLTVHIDITIHKYQFLARSFSLDLVPMEKTEVWESSVSNGREEEQYCNEFEKSAASFPQEEGWAGTLCQYQGFWLPSKDIARSVFSFQQHFQPLDSDIILASMPKSGATWIKALTFAIVNRSRHNFLQESPLNTSNPHDIVPVIEFDLYIENTNPNLEELLLPGPRMLGTHVPYQMLPSSVKKMDSKCRIVCVSESSGPVDLRLAILPQDSEGRCRSAAVPGGRF